MSTEKVTEVKKEAIESEVHAQPIENQGILEEAAHLGGRIAGAAKNTVVAAKDAVVQASQHAVEATKDAAVGAGEFAKGKAVAAKDAAVGAGEFAKGKAVAAGEFTKDKAVAAKEFTKDKAVAAKEYVCGREHDRDAMLGEKSELPHDAMMDTKSQSSLDAGFTTEKKDVQDVMKSGFDSGKRDFSTAFHDTGSSATGHRDWFRDTGVDKNEVMEERRNVMGELTSAEIDKRVGVDQPHIEGSALKSQDLKMGGQGKKMGGLEGQGHHPDWFKDTGVDKQEVMSERQNLVGDLTSAEIDKRVGVDKPHTEGKVGGAALEGQHADWFKDTGVDKQEVMEERRAVLGERTDISKDRFDNTSNTVANKAGQLKDTVSTKAGQLKDSALEKGGQLKDVALEKGGQLKDAAMEKGGQWKDAALEKGGQWKDAASDKAFQLKEDAMVKGSQLKDAAMDKGAQLKESAIIKGQQAKESALETGDQLKGKAIDAGHAVQEKGIALKAAHDKGFVQQEARADKENTRF